MIANVLSIAGSDPSGGAGVQADLKAFAACGVYGMAAITALTAQNTRGVTGALPIPPGFVAAQIAAVLADVRIDAVKIGMLASADIDAAVADALAACAAPIVLDPVMVAKGGAALLAPDAVATIAARFVPRAAAITPNLPEAAALLGAPLARDRAGMAAQARALLRLGPSCVLLKGGHLASADSPDLVVTADGEAWLEGPRTPTRNTHGTGCSLSSALAAFLARGASLSAAAVAAKRYVAGAIAAADALDVGGGSGPVNHFHELWPDGSG